MYSSKVPKKYKPTCVDLSKIFATHRRRYYGENYHKSFLAFRFGSLNNIECLDGNMHNSFESKIQARHFFA